MPATTFDNVAEFEPTVSPSEFDHKYVNGVELPNTEAVALPESLPKQSAFVGLIVPITTL